MPDKMISKDPTSVRITRVFAYLLLLTQLIVWPWFFFPFISSKLFFVLGVTQLMFLGLVWIWSHHPAYRPRGSWVLLSLVAYVAVVLLASVFGVDPLISFWGSSERSINAVVFTHLLVVFLGMITVIRTKRDWVRYIGSAIGVALVVVLLFIISLATNNNLPIIRDFHLGSTLGNSSFFGTYLVFAIFLSLWLAIQAKTTKARVGLGMLTAVFFITILISDAQAAKLATIGGVILFVALVLLLGKHKAAKRTGAVLLVLLALSTAFVFGSLSFPNSAVRQAVVNRSSPGRFILWDMAWKGFKQRPVLGWGPETFSSIFQTFYEPCLGSKACGGEVWFDRAHNKALGLLAETGALGFVTFFSILVAAIWGLWRQVFRGKMDQLEASVFTSLLSAYVVQSLTVFDTISTYLILLVALAYIHSRITPFNSAIPAKKKSVNTIWFWGSIPLICVTFYFFIILPAKASRATNAALSSRMLYEQFNNFETALSASQYGIDLRRSALTAQAAALVMNRTDEERKAYADVFLKELELSRQGLLQTIDRSPKFLRAYLDLIFVYQVWSLTYDPQKFEDAKQIGRLAVDRFPRNPLSYWSYAGILVQEGDTSDALANAQTALDLAPDVAGSLLRFLVTAKLFENEEHAQAFAKRIVDVDPGLQKPVERLLNTDAKENFTRLLFKYYYNALF